MSSPPPASHTPKPLQNPAGPAVWLVDNGSLEPAATRSLREVAGRLAAASGREILPVSLLHSSAIAPAELDGRSAEIFEPKLRALAGQGQRDIVVVPFFLGPSGAIVDYLPGRVRHWRTLWPDLRVRVAPCLVEAGNRQDNRVAAMLAERVREVAAQAGFRHYAVAVVDHGTPQRAVNAVRDSVMAQVKNLLGGGARAVAACSMERRMEAEFDFNEPLLEKLLDAPEFSTGEVVVAKLFLQPGRHAGPGGDVEKICRAAQARHPALKIACTEPLASHPGMIALLQQRLDQGQSSSSIV